MGNFQKKSTKVGEGNRSTHLLNNQVAHLQNRSNQLAVRNITKIGSEFLTRNSGNAFLNGSRLILSKSHAIFTPIIAYLPEIYHCEKKSKNHI